MLVQVMPSEDLLGHVRTE